MKGLQELLKEDSSLLNKITYEEYTDRRSIEDYDDLENAYEAYKEVLQQLDKIKE